MLRDACLSRSDALDEDEFTTDRYRGLLRLAIAHYPLCGYREIPFGRRFLLWRHDCDFSLNRALALAKIEREEGVQATYFINPHSEFYNLFERSQARIIDSILDLGHELGLHFDGDFYVSESEAHLEAQIERDRDLVSGFFGASLSAVSFHNPRAFHLSCETEYYGGLRNCYSRRFKTGVPYCSDSNGYWRFRRLSDVLAAATDPCLQVLTHPCWWQETAMAPRERVFRSVYGRASAGIAFYDGAVSADGRHNLYGFAGRLRFLEPLDPRRYALWDFLCNQRYWESLFIELWRFCDTQMTRLCELVLRNLWCAAPNEVGDLIGKAFGRIDAWWALSETLDPSDRACLTRIDESRDQLVAIRRTILLEGRWSADERRLMAGCSELCESIVALGAWGASRLNNDGMSGCGLLTHSGETALGNQLASTGQETGDRGVSGRWPAYKRAMESASAEAD